MATAGKASFSIVVGLDFEDAGGYAFAQAARIARSVPGCSIHLVHVFEKPLDAQQRERLSERLRVYANEKAAFVGGLPSVSVGIHLRSGDPVQQIVQLASDVSASMIIVGTKKGPHLRSWLLGSISERLLLTAPCPVVVAGPKPPTPDHVPTIEPPCKDCERVRASSGGSKWWCDRHEHHATQTHVYSYQRELPFASHNPTLNTSG